MPAAAAMRFASATTPSGGSNASIGSPAAGDAVADSGKVAVIGGAEVEAAGHEQDADRVEQLAVQQLDADDRVAFRRNPLLDERRAVEPEVELGGGELVDAVERDDADAAAADVRLDEDREAELPRSVDRRGAIVDDARARVTHAEASEKRCLPRL